MRLYLPNNKIKCILLNIQYDCIYGRHELLRPFFNFSQGMHR